MTLTLAHLAHGQRHRRLFRATVRVQAAQKRSPRRSAVVVAAISVVPRAPLPSEAAAESSGHAVPCVLQALQALHSSLEASAGPSHVPVGQHASHERRPAPVDEIRPLESTDSPLICRYMLQAEADVMQVPSGPVHISHPITDMPVRPAAQLSKAQVGSIVTVSPAQPLHMHVVDWGLAITDV